MRHLKQWSAAIAAAALLGLYSCGENSGTVESTTDSVTTAVEAGMDNLENAVDTMLHKDADRDFLSDAVEANALEIRALVLGQQKGSTEVKGHAKHMLADHKKLAEDVNAFLTRKNLALTDVDTSGTDDDLQNKAAGKEFDRAWAGKMVRDHEKVLSMFEDARDDVKDPELKTLIEGAIPKLKAHLDMSRELDKKLNQ